LDIWVSQVGTGSAVNLTQGKTGNLDGLVRALGFSGDGSQIWFHEADVTAPLRIVPLMGGAPRVFLASSPVKDAAMERGVVARRESHGLSHRGRG